MPFHQTARTSPWLTGIALTCVAALCAVLLLNGAKFAYNGWLSVVFPGELDYGEGIVWQQANLIPGPRMYGDIQQYPFLVFHYPPLYHLVVNVVASLGCTWLAAGRIVSLVSLFATAGLAGLFVMETTRQPEGRAVTGWDAERIVPLLAGLLTALLVFSLDPLRTWARTARVDMLACAFEMLGMYLGLRALQHGGPLYASALLFVAALFTKQTMLLGALATFLIALWHDWRGTLRAALVAGTVGAACFAALSLLTDGGFARHIILYNINRFSLSAAIDTGLTMGRQNLEPGYVLIAAAALYCVVARAIATGMQPPPIGERIVAIYTVLAMASLVSLGKTGASSNYFIPVTCATAILIGLAVARAARWAIGSDRRTIGFVALLLVLIVQTLTVPPVGERRLTNPAFRHQFDELLAMIRAAGKPVWSENMVLLMQAGKTVPWEASIITELSAKGIFDERKVLALIDARSFAFFVVNGTQNVPLDDTRYSPDVRLALEKSYPVVRSLAGQRILLPAEQ